MGGHRKRSRRNRTGTEVVLPGLRRTTEARRQRTRIIWIVTIIVLGAIGWLIYRELSVSLGTAVEFSGP